MPTDKLYVISTPQLCIKVEEMYFKYFNAKQHISINEAYQNRIKIQVGNCSPTKKAQNK